MRDDSTHALHPPAPALAGPSLREDDGAFAPAQLGALVLFIIGGFIAAQIAIETLAGMLPSYLTSLGTIFDAINNVNTTGWPSVVATLFSFLDIVLGIVAIAALFGAGALLAVSFRGRKGAGASL
jgi:hypothetical protein